MIGNPGAKAERTDYYGNKEEIVDTLLQKMMETGVLLSPGKGGKVNEVEKPDLAMAEHREGKLAVCLWKSYRKACALADNQKIPPWVSSWEKLISRLRNWLTMAPTWSTSRNPGMAFLSGRTGGSLL